MLVTLLGIVTLVRLVQYMNASDPMLVTLLGIVTLVRLVLDSNAAIPMLMTGRPVIVLGMVTAALVPVYRMMVIVPLLVVKVNWACTATGSVSSKSGRSLVARAVPKRLAIVFELAVLAMEFRVFM